MTPAETRGERGGGNITTTWKIWPTQKLGVGGEGGLGILAIEKHNPPQKLANWKYDPYRNQNVGKQLRLNEHNNSSACVFKQFLLFLIFQYKTKNIEITKFYGVWELRLFKQNIIVSTSKLALHLQVMLLERSGTVWEGIHCKLPKKFIGEMQVLFLFHVIFLWHLNLPIQFISTGKLFNGQ